MDKLREIHDKYGEWPQAADFSETDFSPDDLFNKDMIDTALDLADRNPRKRAILRIHPSLASEQHLMVNAILGESYVQPHRHNEKEKTETFRIIRGEALIVFFDENGVVTEQIKIGSNPDDRKIVTVRPGKWHTLIPLSDETVVLEAKRQPKGGYNPETDKEMAPWAPNERSNREQGIKYVKGVLDRLIVK